MRALVQRVTSAAVNVDGALRNHIRTGLLVYLGIGKDDTAADGALMVRKITEMRLFPQNGKEGVLSVLDLKGEILLISQFTLYADISKGRRPSFTGAMPGIEARAVYDSMLRAFNAAGVPTHGGEFGADMQVESNNNGPYTIWVDTAAL